MKTKLLLRTIFYILILSLSSTTVFAQKELYAGIEIGSKGVKISVIHVSNIKKGNYDIIAYWTENVGIAKGIQIDGKLDQKDIDRAAAVVFENLAKIKNKYAVADDNIFIVGSSGVAMASNTQDLTARVKTLTGKDLEFIDVETEGKMLLKGCIPPKDYESAMVLDIGGGNTKGGYVDTLNDNKFEFFPLSLDYGTITLTEAVNKTIVNKADIDNIEVYKEKSFAYISMLREKVAAMLNSKPIVNRKKNVYLSGGALWAFNELYYNDSANDKNLVPMKLRDVMEYDAILKNNFSKFETLSRTNSNAKKVIETYSQKHLISANNILLTCLETIPDIKSKNIYFAKEGQIAWLVSYVVDRSKKVKINF
ncbi:exopolyphosphatase [Flavobacterium sp. TMP13]|uniref:Ppx/GppA phosphatase family protein n=1 Tax=Flavobacterium sp. TMP13 TaxID=3425950 RepID=UPI003D77CCD6